MFRSRRFPLLFTLAAIVSAALVLPAHAFNTQFLNNTPLSKMNDEDVRLFKEAVYATLDGDADGTARAWSNTKTRAGGEITPVRTFEDGGETCREIEIANSAGGLSNRSRATLCRVPGGAWRLKGS